MIIDGDVLTMCKLVVFADEEKKHAVAANLNPEEYAQEVLERFRILYPDAILLLGDFDIGSDEWKKSLNNNHVRCRIDGVWEFYSKTDSMTIEVGTDGSLDLSEGAAEQIFNYVND